MKHLQAGLVVGVIAAMVLFLGALVWGILSSIVGEGAAVVVFGVVVLTIVIASVIDWMTEKEKK